MNLLLRQSLPVIRKNQFVALFNLEYNLSRGALPARNSAVMPVFPRPQLPTGYGIHAVLQKFPDIYVRTAVQMIR